MRAITYVIAFGLALGLAGCAKEETITTEVETNTAAEKAPELKKSTMDPATKKAISQPAKKTPGVVSALSEEDRARLLQTVASSFGKGSFEDQTGATYTFTMEGSTLKDNSSHGRFRFYTFMQNGKLDVKGEMTCVRINSGERRIWMAGKITENNSTDDKYRTGMYAPGEFLHFRARPNSLENDSPAAIEVPSFVSEEKAEAFCKNQIWSDDGLYDLGANDMIAAIP